MKNNGWFSRIQNQQPTSAGFRYAAAAMALVALMAAPGIVVAQAIPGTPLPESQITTPEGYASHHSIDMGGRIADQSGSGAMYNTLVNLHSGPRLLGQTFEMHALPGKDHGLVDNLSAFSSGFGGDPTNIAKLNMSKAKVFEFSGTFRRGRLYSDYNLLANPNIAKGLSLPIGPSTAPVGSLPWGQVNSSPVMFNTVRRMTDIDLVLAPLATFTYRLGYSRGLMEGPTFSPAYTILKSSANIVRQNERNTSDDYLGAIDWKSARATKISLEVQANHYKSDSSFTLDPNGFNVQEPNGTPAYLGSYTSLTPYGTASCDSGSMGGTPMLSAANMAGGRPVINPACSVVLSYLRTQNTRIWMPTETLRLQSAAFKNITLNGNFHYTSGNSDLPAYYENQQGLSTATAANAAATRASVWTGGHATARREVIGSDFGIVWQVAPTVSLSEQFDYASEKQPGNSIQPLPTTLLTPGGANNQTINYNGPLTVGTGSLPHGVNSTLTYNYYGQGTIINNLTAAWDATTRARFSLTYRYGHRNIGQGVPHNIGIDTSTDPYRGTVLIDQNAGVFNAALRPTSNWDLNGTAEISYDDNALTPVAPRQGQLYRVHTLYRAKPWATISGSLSDRERHNNTNNYQAGAAYYGPINHVDHSRVGSVGVDLSPNEQYSLNLNYSYSDVYSATNICYNSGAAAATATGPAMPGSATLTDSGAPNVCALASNTWHGRDFMDAPTQFGSVGVSYSPTVKFRTSVGYTVSAVNGSRFFNDARDVNGSMVSTYQSPFFNISYAIHPSMIWKAEYNYYGYGEGGPSGATTCTTTVLTASTPISTITTAPCSSLPYTALHDGSSVTARNFHANHITLGIHYEF